ncbi:MAG: ORF6N domain-containing protein [Prolixibacteraceae bacterium]|nr:ORF6N domain-containing protein [Prolixibacteraceae bacterium]
MEQPALHNIENKIFTLRGVQVMLDKDLAELYQVNVKVLNQAVKRNIKRFPQRFRFQLDENEYFNLRSQIVTLEQGRGKHRKYLPYVFTEQGVAMLSSVLRSDIAANISIHIMDAFIAMRKFLMQNALVFQRLDKLETKMLKTDEKFEKVFKALEAGQLKPDKGTFFNGQIFDADSFVADSSVETHGRASLQTNHQQLGHYHTRNYIENHNPCHRLWVVSNRQSIQKSTIILTNKV